MNKSQACEVVSLRNHKGNSSRFLKLAVWTSLIFFVTAADGTGPKNLIHGLGGEAADNGQILELPQEKSKAPTIEVSTRLVQASVVVEDKHGNPVPGLQKDDFIVLDEGQPQTVSVFSVTTNQISSAAAVPVPPDTFTNQGNAAQLRVVLRDVSSGLAGTVAVPLEKYFPRASTTSK
jgi:hypothetical protein